MTIEPKVAVIILNYNGFDDTVECLKSLRNLEYNNYKIVLVDNDSANNEGERLRKQFPEVHFIGNETNRGFSGGNNDGMNWALDNGFEYIVNLNNDCIVEKDCLSNLVHGIISKNADFGTSRIMFYPEKDLICSDGDALLLEGRGFTVNYRKRYTGPDRIRPIFYACGAGSIYSKRCLQSVKIKGKEYFDELFFAYYEDLDLGIRLNMKLWNGICVPDAVIYHKLSSTSLEYSRFKVFHSEKNRILNEILNYPVYLFLVGELYFFLKAFFLSLYSIFNRTNIGYRYIRNVSLLEMMRVFVTARAWVLTNISAILKDRKERKTKGFINNKILGFISWNKILK